MNKLNIPTRLIGKEELLSENELTIQLKGLERYLDKDVIEYLYSVINMEISILNNEDINKSLGELKLFRDIATYNILNRTQNVISKIEELDKDRISAVIGKNYLQMYYKDTQGDSFIIFNSDLGTKKRLSNEVNEPYIHIFEKDSVKLLEKQKKLVYLDDTIYNSDNIYVGETINGLPVYAPVYGGPNSRKILENAEKRKILKENIKKLEQMGTEKDKITKIVSNVLVSDWNMELEKEQVKSLKWVQIKKTSNIR